MRTLIILALMAQLSGADPFEGEKELERSRLSRIRGTFFQMMAVQAVHEDGTAAPGFIACDGSWFKHQDCPRNDCANTKIDSGLGLPFETDSRGLVIWNPMVGENEETPVNCSARDKHGHKGSTSFFLPTNRQEIVVK